MYLQNEKDKQQHQLKGNRRPLHFIFFKFKKCYLTKIKVDHEPFIQQPTLYNFHFSMLVIFYCCPDTDICYCTGKNQ